MNKKLFIVLKREYLVRVRAKGFIVLTVLIPALLAGFILVETKIIKASNEVQSRLAVVDLSQQLFPQLEQAMAGNLPDGRPRYQIERVDPNALAGGNLAATRAQLSARVLAGSLDGYIIVPADVLQTRVADYHVRNAAAVEQARAIEDRLATAVNRTRMLAAGIPASQLDQTMGGFDLHQLKVTKQGDTADQGQSAVVAWVLVIVLYVFMIMYGVTVMKSVTEEKTTRISEILLSSVDAFSLMFGKILGVASAALTQFVVWGVFLALLGGYGLAMAKASGAPALAHLPRLSPWLYITFVIFFVLGFLVYASIYASIGAMVSSDQEAQQSQTPITMLLLVAYLCAVMVMNNPASPTSVILSLVPFFAPILMTLRVAVSNPPLWQVLMAMLLCLATLLALTKVTAKIYRVGILMTGKRPNLPEILKWLKYA